MEPNPTQVVCGACGPVHVDACRVDVHRNRRERFAVFAVPCPGCGDLVVGGCPDQIKALERAGARHLELRSTDAPPITVDDLLDFHQWLATDPAWPPPGH